MSARRFPNMRRMVPVRNVLLIGQYGLEGPLGPPTQLLKRLRRGCARVARALRPLVASVRGALLEVKGLTVAVHDRNVRDARRLRELRRGLKAGASLEARSHGFVPVTGRRLADFWPRG